VRRERADLGVGFDGDGDRLGVIDDQGEIIWGDRLMILYWREILPRHPGTVGIVEVKCSQTLYDEIARLGGRPIFYRTGHSLIKAKMREVGAVFTGEMSGHMFFADEYYGYDDAVYAAARLLRILSHAAAPLSGLLADVPRYPATPEIRVACPDEVKFQVVAEIAARFKRSHTVIDIDGARVLFDGGWGLVRASNTQPALVLRAEGVTEDALARIKAELAAALRAHPAVGPLRW
jgi:phosphomannomutase/phosphoglucomutase